MFFLKPRAKYFIFFLYYRSGSTLLEGLLGLPWRQEQALGRDPVKVYSAYKARHERIFLPTIPSGICPLEDISTDVRKALTEKLPFPYRAWTLHIGDWWGSCRSDQIPLPYEQETPNRWGPEELKDLGGQFRFVSLVRDGRDQIESLRRLRNGIEEKLNQADASDYFKVLCKGFRNRARLALDCQKQLKNYKLFRFEDLIENPLKTTNDMFDFFGLKMNKDLVQKNLEITHQRRGLDHSSFSHVESYSRWQTWTDEEKSIFKTIAGQELAEMSYTKDLNW